MALIPIVPADEYVAGLGRKARAMLREADRAGYEFRTFAWNDHLDDVYGINTSKPVRSGGPMTAGYSERPKPSTAVEELCAVHRRYYFGGFQDGRLRAYCHLAVLNDLAMLVTIIGHADALPDGVMNGLIRGLVRLCGGCPTVRYLNYWRLEGSGGAGLEGFKRRVGFQSIHVRLS